MKALTVAGGVYHERCIWPDWDFIYGSAGRAAAAVSNQVDKVSLHSYIRPDTLAHFQPYVSAYGFELIAREAPQTMSFEYVHSLSTPAIRPVPAIIEKLPNLLVEDDVVLRFGMMESSVNVCARRVVYDPQSAFAPEDFYANGSSAKSLAIVGNSAEIKALSKNTNPIDGAAELVASGKVEVVVVKSGPEGAWVVESNRKSHIPAFQTEAVWTIGTGDVFAAVFAAQWGVHEKDPVEAAHLASLGVASYVNTRALPIPMVSELESLALKTVELKRGNIYLAGPFFCTARRWIVDEARRYLSDFGMEVFSPVHDVGRGPAEVVAPKDLQALRDCDVVFALLDGMDAGTVFEVGYATAIGKPIYAIAQSVSAEDLKMLRGSGTKIYRDFVTAIHHAVWRTQ